MKMRKLLNIDQNLIYNRLKYLAGKNYFTAKSFYKFSSRLQSRRIEKPPVILYQMGKVGSSTIKKSLQAADGDLLVCQIHYLTDNFLKTNERKYRQRFRDFPPATPEHHWLSQILRKQLDRNFDGRKWKIVTLVREPVARNISAFFENLIVTDLNSGTKFKVKSFYDFELTVTGENFEKLFELFLAKYDHETPLEYFDREFKGMLNFDIYASAFPKSKGYQIYEDERFDVLLIRLEDLNNCARTAFKEFLDMENFNLSAQNIGSRKSYNAIYKSFLKNVNLPLAYLDQMYRSKYAQHFYTPEEIENYRKKWCRK